MASALDRGADGFSAAPEQQGNAGLFWSWLSMGLLAFLATFRLLAGMQFILLSLAKELKAVRLGAFMLFC